jgi:DNA-binding transcriptional MerR regulator
MKFYLIIPFQFLSSKILGGILNIWLIFGIIKTMEMLTIGQLAARAGIRTSAIRYYEQENLLEPTNRSASGYRLYAPESEQYLHFIQRAQRLGFSLADIRTLISSIKNGAPVTQEIIQVVDDRYLSLERQLTEGLVLRHELELFLQDFHQKVEQTAGINGYELLNGLLERVCANPMIKSTSGSEMLSWMINYTGCQLNTNQGRKIIEKLRGQHFHIWKEEKAYFILVISEDPAIGSALKDLADIESSCQAHSPSNLVPEWEQNEEGFLLSISGDNAFLFARLFLSL